MQYPPLNPSLQVGTLNPRYITSLISNYYSIGWPDTVQGLLALKNQFIIATLSNGNVRLLIDMVIEFFSTLVLWKLLNFSLAFLGEECKSPLGYDIFHRVV